MVRARRGGKPLIGITCEVHKLRPYYSEFELICDYRYVRSILRAGGNPLLLPVNQDPATLRALMKRIDGLVIIGGTDIHPCFYGEKSRHKIEPAYRGRIRYDMRLYEAARRLKMPVMAICFGMQLLNVIHGGSLYQDIRKQVRGAKNHTSKRCPLRRVRVKRGARLARIIGKHRFWVHCEHHQAVKKLGEGLRAAAFSTDGIIEAFEGPPKTIAIQWHPERQARDPLQRRLFRHFVLSCRN